MSAQEAHTGRRFVRHPISVPVLCSKQGHVEVRRHESRDISQGGLSFVSREPYAPGDIVGLEFPSLRYKATLRGEIVWSSPLSDLSRGGLYWHGLRFLDEHGHQGARLIEQVCRIECYRRAQVELYGRYLSSRQAAEEWIARHAEHFPE